MRRVVSWVGERGPWPGPIRNSLPLFRPLWDQLIPAGWVGEQERQASALPVVSFSLPFIPLTPPPHVYQSAAIDSILWAQDKRAPSRSGGRFKATEEIRTAREDEDGGRVSGESATLPSRQSQAIRSRPASR